MTNPANEPRDDRRMHEGRKPGLGETENQGGTDTLDRKEDREAAIDRERAERPDRTGGDGLKGQGGTADRDPQDRGGDPVQQAQQWSGGSKASKGPVTSGDRANENSTTKS